MAPDRTMQTRCASLLVLFLALACTEATLYGLTRVRNSNACSGAVSGCAQLVSVDAATGVLTNIGVSHHGWLAYKPIPPTVLDDVQSH